MLIKEAGLSGLLSRLDAEDADEDQRGAQEKEAVESFEPAVYAFFEEIVGPPLRVTDERVG